MNRRFSFLFLGLCLIFLGQISSAQDLQSLYSNASIENEISGGQEIKYQIALADKQFVRFRLEQKAIDAALILTAPDGKQLIEMNLTRGGDEESLSFEASVPGNYLAKGLVDSSRFL